MRDLYTQLCNKLSFLHIITFPVLILGSLILLQACTTGSPYGMKPWLTPTGAPIRPAEQTPNDLSVATVQRQTLAAPTNQHRAQTPNNGAPSVKVALLLPLSGSHEKLGKSMLNAAQIAVFDIGEKNFEIIPYDTSGTPNGARKAARNALNDGARLVLGPVFSPAVKAARQVTQSANVNMIAFSTDWTLANTHTFLIGFLPFDQVERITYFASYAGHKKICVLSPNDTYGNAVISAYQAVSPRSGIETACINQFSNKKNSLSNALRSLSNYDQRKAKRAAHEKALIAEGRTPDQARIASLEEAPEDLPFDAILMPVGGSLAREVGSFLNHYDLPPEKVKRLGTGLFDDDALAQDRSLKGAWFAGPEPQSRAKFERRYSKFYSQTPPRLASIAYDATALAAILARIGMQKNRLPAYDRASITNPNGFSGVDGIFRFRSDGIVERGLAVLEYKDGHITVIDKAPKTFQSLSH